MKKTLFPLLLLCLFSCNKIDLSEDKEEEKPVEPNLPEYPNDEFVSVKEALSLPFEDYLNLQGYIVGYVAGNSIKSGAQFSVPTDKKNTNMLLADHKDITDPTLCIAVKLENNGKFPTRDELNLLDHPEYFKKLIKIEGYLSKYFSKNGITKVFEFELSENENEGEKPLPEDTLKTPDLSDEEELIPEGRSQRF